MSIADTSAFPHPTESGVWERFDLSDVTNRFEKKNSFGRFAGRLELETRRFLYLCATESEPCAPSAIVDEYWHAMILNTSVYRAYCETALGQFIEHNAGPASTSDEARQTHLATLRRTVARYREVFGDPPPDLWLAEISGDEIPEKYSRPHRLHLETTNHCNLRCEHCYPASSPDIPHHDADVVKGVIQRAKREDIGKVTLTGGEFLSRPDWKDIFNEALDAVDNIYIISNGLTLTDAKLKWMAKQRVKKTLKNVAKSPFKPRIAQLGIAVSLDGLEGNGLVRKNGQGKPVDAEKVLKRIALACDYGIHVTVNTTLTNPISARELPEMYDRLSKMGIDRWQLDQAYNGGRYQESDLLDTELNWLEEAKAGYKYIVENYLKDYPKIPDWRLEIVQVFRYDMLISGFAPAASLDEHPCSYHFGSVIVEGGDEVRFCPSLRNNGIGRPTGDDKFADVLERSDEFKDFLSKSINDLPCKECRYSKMFHGGCRANSFSYAGKMWDRDPICCSLSPFVEDEIVPLLPQHLREQFLAGLTGGSRPDERPGAKRPRRRSIPVTAG